jgi:hypothetical protein
MGAPFHVDAHADTAGIESARQALDQRLRELEARARALL